MSFSYTHKVMSLSFCHIFLRFRSHHHDSEHHKTVKKCGDRLSQNMVLLQYFSLSFCSSISLDTIFSGSLLKWVYNERVLHFISCVCKQELWSQLTATECIGLFMINGWLYIGWAFTIETYGLNSQKRSLLLLIFLWLY